MSESWHSYPKIYNLGHKCIQDLLADPVVIEEKVDGSQFSFGLFEDGLRCKSKEALLNLDAPEKMFSKAVETVKNLESLLKPGWTYRAEYLQKPKHNVLAYDRVPKDNLIIFDINTSEEAYLNIFDKKAEADRLGLECVQSFQIAEQLVDVTLLHHLLTLTSILGGQKIEGVVIKNYNRFNPHDGKCLMGKHVSEAFKENHKGNWRLSNPTGNDILQSLIIGYRTPARWHKAVQHLRERGLITDSPKDIGLLMKEFSADFKLECEDEIKEHLFKWAFSYIDRGAKAGLAQWYKEQLMAKQFEGNNEASDTVVQTELHD
jgi:hypothetical protein